MNRIGIALVWILVGALVGVAGVSAQDDDTVLGLLLEVIDDTSCGDGIGRTYRGKTLISAIQHDDVDDFYARHESCAGSSGATAALGRTPLPVGLTGRCNAAIEIPGVEYEWVLCGLGFTARDGLTTPVHIELDEFFLFTDDDQKLASYPHPDLYVGQPNDMSAGIDFSGPEPAFGVVAFPAFPGQVDGPFVVRWETTGDNINTDELEPDVAEAFLYHMGFG